MRGLFSAGAGMLANQLRLDVVANNLANAATIGFQRDTTVNRAFPSLLLHRIGDSAGARLPAARPPVVGRLGTGVFVEETVTRFEPGPLRETGNPLDLALVGEGFFLLETEGRFLATRAGHFARSADGWLVAPDGPRVMSAEGTPIPVGEGEVTVDETGTVYAGGREVGRLALVGFDNPDGLEKVGGQRFAVTAASGPPFLADGVRVQQGSLEGSTVNVVAALVEMIEATRAYEAAQRLIRVYDETLARAAGDLGRIA